MDTHTKIIVAGLLEYQLGMHGWNFNELSPIQQQIIGNQAQVDILKKFSNDIFKHVNGE